MARRVSPVKAMMIKDVANVSAGNWTKDAADNDATTMCRASVLQSLGTRINYLLAMGRINFSQYIPYADGYDSATDADPLWQFRINDYIDNGRQRLWNVLSVPRTTAPAAGGDAIAHLRGAPTKATAVDAGSTDAVTSTDATQLEHQQFTEERGDPTDTVATVGLNADQGMRVLGLTVQDEPLDELLAASNRCVAQLTPRSGDDVIADRPEDLREKLHHLRSECLPPVAWWSANTPTTGATPTSSDWDGFVETASSYTNILDGSSTSRTASSPGVSAHCQYCNRQKPISNHMVVKTEWYFLAMVGASGAGNVQIIGPRASASQAVTATTPTWVGPLTLYLNGDKADDDVTTSRNKVDILSRETTGGSIYIYGWTAFMTYY